MQMFVHLRQWMAQSKCGDVVIKTKTTGDVLIASSTEIVLLVVSVFQEMVQY